MNNKKNIDDKYLEDKLKKLHTPSVNEAKKQAAIAESLKAFNETTVSEETLSKTSNQPLFLFMKLRPALESFSIFIIAVTVGLFVMDDKDSTYRSSFAGADLTENYPSPTLEQAVEEFKAIRDTDNYNKQIALKPQAPKPKVYYGDGKVESLKEDMVSEPQPLTRSLKKEKADIFKLREEEVLVSDETGDDAIFDIATHAEGFSDSDSADTEVIAVAPLSKPIRTTAVSNKSKAVYPLGASGVAMSESSQSSSSASTYNLVRNSLLRGFIPKSESVNIEEMVDHFSYDYSGPGNDKPFKITPTLYPSPWSKDNYLVHVAIKGQEFNSLLKVVENIKVELKLNDNFFESYRIVGFDNHDGGLPVAMLYDLRPGETRTVIYEVVLNNDASLDKFGDLGSIKVSYDLPNTNTLKSITEVISPSDRYSQFSNMPSDIRFATAVAAFSQMLKGVGHITNIDLNGVKSIALASKGRDKSGKRTDFIKLIGLAEDIKNRNK